MAIPSTFRRHRRALGRELRAVREAASRSGNQLAGELGWAQSKVSRIETGSQIATEGDVSAWCSHLGVPRSEEIRLLSLLHQAEAEYLSWKESYRLAGSPAKKQEEILRYEKQSRRVFEFQPSVVPGLLQTQAYASELLRLPAGPILFGASQADIAEMVAIRMKRQESLYDTSKKVSVVILEQALRTRVVPTAVLLEQLLRLRDLNQFTEVSLNIVPSSTRLPMIPLGGFVIYDDDLVVLEHVSGEQHLSEASEIRAFRLAADALLQSAVAGESARKIVERAIVETII